MAAPSVAPIGSGRDYNQDFTRGADFGFLVSEGYAQNMVETSLRFALSNAGVSTVVGYSDMDHLEQSVEYAAKGPLPAEALARLPAVWSKFVGA